MLNGPMADDEARIAAAVRTAGLVSGLAWLIVAVAWGEGPFALTFDDAFYYFEIAQRLATDGSSTFDGINLTNGYHPLWMAVCTVAFWPVLGLEPMASVRLLLAVQALTWAGTWWVLAGMVGRSVAGWPAIGDRERRPGAMAAVLLGTVSLLVAANPTVARIAVSGLESGLVLLIGAGLLAVSCGVGSPNLIGDAGSRRRWALGILLALAFLARTDHILAVGAMALALAVEVRAAPPSRRLALIRSASPVLVPPVVVIAATMAFNQAVFGAPMQISGLVKRASIDGSRLGSAMVLAVAVIAVVVVGRWEVGPRSKAPRTRRFLTGTSWYAAFVLGVVGYYTILSTQQWLWYYAPALLWGSAALLHFVVDLCEAAVADSGPDRSPNRPLAGLGAIVVVPLLIGMVTQWPTFVDPDRRSIQVANRDAGLWASENLPADAVLASWDAGVLGFFTDQPVVNIDGVVNSIEWHRATEDGPEAVRRFLDDLGVGYLANHGGIVEGHDPSIVSFVELIWGPDAAAGLTLVHTQPFTYSGTLVGSAGASSASGETAVFIYRLP